MGEVHHWARRGAALGRSLPEEPQRVEQAAVAEVKHRQTAPLELVALVVVVVGAGAGRAGGRHRLSPQRAIGEAEAGSM